MVAKKISPTKLNALENKFDIDDLFTNGENHWSKTPPGEFKVSTSENPLLSKQAVTRNSSTLYQPTIEPLLQYRIGLVL